MRTIQALLTIALLWPVCHTAHGQADKLKIKARQVWQSGFSEKRAPVDMMPIGDRTLLVMIDHADDALVRNHAKSLPRFELFDRTKITSLRGQDPVARVKAGDLFVDRMVDFRGDAVMIATRRDTVKGTTELYWQKLDPNLTKTHPHFILLSAFDTRTFGDGKLLSAGTGHHDRFLTSVSPDGGALLVYSTGIVDKDGGVHRPMIVAGEHMAEIWKHNYTSKDNVPVVGAQVDNAGVAYLLESIRVKPEEKRDTTRQAIRLRRVDQEGATDMANGLTKGHWIKSAIIKPWTDGRLIVAGIYGGLDPKGEPVLGEFTGMLAVGGSALEEVVQRPFELDGEDGAATKNGLRFLDVHPSGDGGVYLVREYFLETDAVDAKTSMSGLRWIHGPVTVTRRNAAGKVDWSTTFRRLYYSTDRSVGHVMSTVHKGEPILFLLDSDLLAEKRKKGEKKLIHTDQKSPYSAYVHFTADGTFRSKSILNGSDGTSYLAGERVWQLKPGDLLVLGASKPNGRNAGLVRIELAE